MNNLERNIALLLGLACLPSIKKIGSRSSQKYWAKSSCTFPLFLKKPYDQEGQNLSRHDFLVELSKVKHLFNFWLPEFIKFSRLWREVYSGEEGWLRFKEDYRESRVISCSINGISTVGVNFFANITLHSSERQVVFDDIFYKRFVKDYPFDTFSNGRWNFFREAKGYWEDTLTFETGRTLRNEWLDLEGVFSDRNYYSTGEGDSKEVGIRHKLSRYDVDLFNPKDIDLSVLNRTGKVRIGHVTVDYDFSFDEGAELPRVYELIGDRNELFVYHFLKDFGRSVEGVSLKSHESLSNLNINIQDNMPLYIRLIKPNNSELRRF